uniref:Uncharacterized protein n=1 Tax=Opuntia streptacantha TaxID=393608 RepID=A0A7C9AKZ2_OPUST
MKQLPQAAPCHILIQQQIRTLLIAKPIKLHNIPMSNLSKSQDLSPEAVLNIIIPFPVRSQPLNCYYQPCLHHCLVDHSTSTPSNNIAIMKIVRRHNQVMEGESFLWGEVNI